MPAPVRFIKPLDVKSPSIIAPAEATFVASVTSALLSIPSSFVLSASVKLFFVRPLSPTEYVVLVSVAEIVTESDVAFVVIVTLEPAINDKVSVVVSAATVVCPDTATFEKAF